MLSRKIGFRRVELVQRALEDQDGSSFFFQINNKPIYAGGSNWIPIDMTLPTSEGRYRRWLELMVRGNQNMIRVWGGGVYEPECFYSLCDEMGIMVWQDFMFACGVYPVFQHFLDNVQKEAEYNVERLRNHPSMTLFCGNNEDCECDSDSCPDMYRADISLPSVDLTPTPSHYTPIYPPRRRRPPALQTR